MTNHSLFLVATAAALAPTGYGFAPPHMLRPLLSHFSSSSSSSSSPSLGMFTGIIEEVGEVLTLETKNDMLLWDGSRGTGTEMLIKGNIVLDGAYLGCSICVNGVCLTATEIDMNAKTFRVGLAPETLRRSNLGSLSTTTSATTTTQMDDTTNEQQRRKVNLERASEIGGRNSGHFVQGHVDDVGTIIDRWEDANSLYYKVSLPPEHMRYIVEKGFVAVDGTSLTVCNVGVDWFSVMLVEYTQKKIILPDKMVGDTVNIEVDVLGKYSESAWGAFMPKMEMLERKVQELEEKVMRLEGGRGAGSSRGQVIGEVIPRNLSATRDTSNSGDGTDWVRTKQTFYNTNY